MPGKQLAPKDVFRAPVSPSASSVAEAVQHFAPPGLGSVWKSVKRGANRVRRAVTGSSGSSQAPSESAEEPGLLDHATDVGSSIVDTVSGAVEGAVDTVSEGVGSGVEAAAEFVNQEPHVRLAHLYSELGATDAFLRAVYADAELRGAALDLGAARLVGFLAEATLTDTAVQEAPAAFSGQIDTLLDDLPVGSAMPREVRDGLRRVLPAFTVQQAMKAFGVRFAHGMQDNGASWTLDNITRVWDQLDVLPDQDISDLTVLTTFQAIAGGGGFGPSWEAPDTVNTIQLGQDGDPAHLAHTVRHEVAHAVHAEIPGQINPWLQNDIQFWFYDNTTSGVRTWINELGGFPATYTNPNTGDEANWDATAESWVISMLQTFIGSGSSWAPARPSVEAGQGGWQQAWWAAMPENVRNAPLLSPPHWYANYANFAQGTKGRYFLNYWYARPFYMSDLAKQVVDATGDDYTAMSEKEFFANAYAEYFKDPAGYNDHSKWGGSLPGSVQDFFQRVIVERQPYEAPNGQVQDNADQAGVGQPPGPTGMAGTP